MVYLIKGAMEFRESGRIRCEKTPELILHNITSGFEIAG